LYKTQEEVQNLKRHMVDSSIDQNTLLREKEENIERLETRVVDLKEEMERMQTQ
jgi:hypothetical protein